MLEILRKVFDFSDWQTSHPKEPPPGDMLDASFDAQDAKINEILAQMDQIQRSDGKLRAGLITRDSLSPALLAEIVADAENRLNGAVSAAVSAKNVVESLKMQILSAAARAETAADDALAVNASLDPAKSAVLARISALDDRANALLAEIQATADDLVTMDEDWQTSRAEAEAWALSSQAWAEYMPDKLPDNLLKVMDITGDHWSSRWWANKATAAFGMLTALYLGAHPVPPTTNLNGGPIEIGSIYYNTLENQAYVWNGTSWQLLASPVASPTAVSTLIYQAGAAQTVFTTTLPDLNGHIWNLNDGEPVGVHVNGVKKIMDVPGALGDYTVDSTANTITFLAAVPANATVIIDIYVNPGRIAPAQVNAWAIQNIDLDPATGLPGYLNGTRTAFTLKAKAAGVVVAVTRAEELLVSVDGVPQEPGIAYTAVGNQITFTDAPEADSYVFITWYQANGNINSSGDGDLRYVKLAGGDTIAGNLNLDDGTAYRATAQGLLSIFGKRPGEIPQLRLWADMSANHDGDYDADMVSKANMYLVAGAGIHLIPSTNARLPWNVDGTIQPGGSPGRVRIVGNEAGMYIQSGGSYNSQEGPGKAITGISKAANAVFTCVAHGFTAGVTVAISDIPTTSMREMNSKYGVCAVVDADHFTIGVDSTGYSTWTTGGEARNMGQDPWFTDLILTRYMAGAPWLILDESQHGRVGIGRYFPKALETVPNAPVNPRLCYQVAARLHVLEDDIDYAAPGNPYYERVALFEALNPNRAKIDLKNQTGAASWIVGQGSPEGVVTAPVGSLFSNTTGAAGTSLYVKQSGTGNTGWAAK